MHTDSSSSGSTALAFFARLVAGAFLGAALAAGAFLFFGGIVQCYSESLVHVYRDVMCKYVNKHIGWVVGDGGRGSLVHRSIGQST